MLKNLYNIKNKMKLIINGGLFQTIQNIRVAVPLTLKAQSPSVLRIWAHQCECVLAQRLRRCQQMFCLYTKLWEERALKDLLNRIRQQIAKHSKEFMLSAVGIASYNWESNRIPTEDIKKHMNELDYLHLLTEKTLGCDQCKASLLISGKCTCENKDSKKTTFDQWSPFVEKKDMIVWRRLYKDEIHYEYKVYGSFDDISGEDFLNVQINTEYRKTWDTTAVALEVIEKDLTPRSNSDIIYWEMLWPKLFMNRDYVFNRRFMIDLKNKTIIIVSRGTKHPACPIRRDRFRVNTYWSYMVIKPYTSLEKPGIEFGLTYYDDPGVNIPATVSTWVAMRAMPDYLVRLRLATRNYKMYCSTTTNKQICNLYKEQIEMDEKDAAHKKVTFNSQEVKDVSPEKRSFFKEIKQTIKFRFSKRKQSQENGTSPKTATTTPSTHRATGTPGEEVMTSPSPIIQAENNNPNWWKYLHPHYYFS